MGLTINGPLMPRVIGATWHPITKSRAQGLHEAIGRRLYAVPGWRTMVGARLFEGFGTAYFTDTLPYVAFYQIRTSVATYGFEDDDKNQWIYIQFSIFADTTIEAEQVGKLIAKAFDPARPETAGNFPPLSWIGGTAIDTTDIGGPMIETKERATGSQKMIAMKVSEWCFEVNGDP